METVIDAMVQPPPGGGGGGKTLKDLGYIDVGLDDAYQVCGAGVNGSFHAWQGRDLVAVINGTKFPDLKAMTARAHALGLRAGFYQNNCICRESNPAGVYYSDAEVAAHYHGDVQDLMTFGFDSVKIDNCGMFKDLERYQRVMNATGRYFNIENCHWGETVPTHDWCPFSFYRTSGDINNQWDRMFANLQTLYKFTTGQDPLSRPGCWAYADMLEVGNMASYEANRAHFGAWAVTSNPLILGMDVRNTTAMEWVWDIIANEEVIGVNQAWAGHPGRLVAHTRGSALRAEDLPQRLAEAGVDITAEKHLNSDRLLDETQTYAKPLPGGKAAAYVINNTLDERTVTINFALAGFDKGAWVSVRCAYGHKNLGFYQGEFTVEDLPGHDSRLFILTPAKAVPSASA
eukprot:CAMPEP_0118888496 /NCGR_PEP_ID=MMETSP1163-20130328/25747_1 /TAXON_ID=124430 /ORGANISM="Phaeomonas parva, Strain CCMP2877" /LENGTH=401 /DNA_ID=CAMNT_0006827063 /DNA_START=588 /DNA_END=1793 /DNA_ORIENTATION=-